MNLYVCPQCEVLYDVCGLGFFTTHCVCDECGYEGSFFVKKEWPKNYISHLMALREYHRQVYTAVKSRKETKEMKYYQALVFSEGERIHDLCRRYGVDFNEIKSLKSS